VGRQRKLAAPLVLGELPGFMAKMFGALARDLRGVEVEASESTLVGMPASAGRATGKVRVVRSPADFDRLAPGEVLVARTTAPAWTPLFARAVAIVTDGGSIVAHASLVAREYGIPAVVGTGNATERLHDGQWVTVDGTLGRVDILDARDP
jgi:rifampicin phosphotransferase